MTMPKSDELVRRYGHLIGVRIGETPTANELAVLERLWKMRPRRRKVPVLLSKEST